MVFGPEISFYPEVTGCSFFLQLGSSEEAIVEM